LPRAELFIAPPAKNYNLKPYDVGRRTTFMPQRKQSFVNGEYYHIISKALDNNLIFKDEDDYFRGIFSIYEFNNSNPVSILRRRQQRKNEKKLTVRDPTSYGLPIDKRDRFVDVLVFSFMPNHIHLLVKQVKDNGIPEFMKKVCGGYGRYFNQKYSLKGYVFQNRFKDVHIENDEQLRNVSNYIHNNATSLIEPGWKENGIKDINKALEFLENYKWSSLQDYIGKVNFPSVTQRDFLLEFFGCEQKYKEEIKNWVLYKSKQNEFSDLFIE
jgi:putative transposase